MAKKATSSSKTKPEGVKTSKSSKESVREVRKYSNGGKLEAPEKKPIQGNEVIRSRGTGPDQE